jgi:curved DNA-binding protein CbpA
MKSKKEQKEKKDYYGLLALEKNKKYSDAEIKKAYRKEALVS